MGDRLGIPGVVGFLNFPFVISSMHIYLFHLFDQNRDTTFYFVSYCLYPLRLLIFSAMLPFPLSIDLLGLLIVRLTNLVSTAYNLCLHATDVMKNFSIALTVDYEQLSKMRNSSSQQWYMSVSNHLSCTSNKYEK